MSPVLIILIGFAVFIIAGAISEGDEVVFFVVAGFILAIAGTVIALAVEDSSVEAYRIENVVRIIVKGPDDYEVLTQNGDSLRYVAPPGQDSIIADVPIGQPMYVDCQPREDETDTYRSIIHVRSLEDVEVPGTAQTTEATYRP